MEAVKEQIKALFPSYILWNAVSVHNVPHTAHCETTKKNLVSHQRCLFLRYVCLWSTLILAQYIFVSTWKWTLFSLPDSVVLKSDMRIAEWAWGTGVCLYMCVCVHAFVRVLLWTIYISRSSIVKNRIYAVLWLMQLADTDTRKHSPVCLVSIVQKSDMSHCSSSSALRTAIAVHMKAGSWLSQTTDDLVLFLS